MQKGTLESSFFTVSETLKNYPFYQYKVKQKSKINLAYITVNICGNF